MKKAHLIRTKVFSYEDKGDDKLVLNKLLQFFPFNLKDQKIELQRTEARGFNEKRIIVFEVTLQKEKYINQFIENLVKNIGKEQRKLILSQIESRLDDDLDFFLRFDKDEYIKNNVLKLTDSGNCFHIEMSIAAFPKKREIALEIVKRIFNPN